MSVVPSQLDQAQILQHVFDDETRKLRVAATVSVDQIFGEVSVELDAADGDNVAISNADGSKKATLTTVSGKNGLDVNVVGIGPTTLGLPSIENIEVIDAGVEDVIIIPASTKSITLQLRNVASMRIAFNSGETETNYYSIGAGSSYDMPNLQLTTSLNLYYQTSTPTVIEVLTWS